MYLFELVGETPSEDESDQRRAKKMKTIGATDPNHLSAWFDREVGTSLWMPSSTMLNALSKPRDRSPAQPDVAMAPLLTSWFGVHHYEDATLSPWRGRDPSLAAEVARHSWKRPVQDESSLPPGKIVNSCLKVRLYPDQRQRENLGLMFATNRAIYKKLVGSSRDDCRCRLVLRGGKNDNEKMSVAELGSKYRPIAQIKTMAGYFRNNKKAFARRMQVQDETRDSAYRDFMKAVTSSLALYYALKRKRETTTFPGMRFRSKFAASNSIETRARSISVVQQGEKQLVRFHPTFFEFGRKEGIQIREPLPELLRSVRLQRLRKGEYYLVVPRSLAYRKTQSTRAYDIDPGVRKFVTIYNPDGRTFYVKDDLNVLVKRFKRVDAMKARLSTLVESSGEKYRHQIKKKTKPVRRSKRKRHRMRYRLRRKIRFTNRRVTRMVHDMHHKIAS